VIEHLSATGGTITLRLSEALIAEGTPASFVVIEVIDNGAGMDGDARERMFEPFFTTKGAEGSGLGLSIVYQIVSLAGGFIRVYSQPEQGTSVRMYLPRIAPAD
jgi:signal transduction histidine kinase